MDFGFLGNSNSSDRIKALEKRTEKINQTNQSILSQLENIKTKIAEVEKRSPEYESEAKQSSKKASEFKNRASEKLDEVNLVLVEAEKQKGIISGMSIELSKSIINVKQEYEGILLTREEITLKQNEIFEKIQNVEDKIIAIEGVFTDHPEIENEIQQIENLFAQVEEAQSKSSLILKTITSRKNDIDRLHEEIIGYKQVDEETNEETFISGLKTELEEAYDGLDEKLGTLKTELNTLEEKSNSNYVTFLKSSEESNKSLQQEWESKYIALNKKIEDLLPNALTAGLSYAFSEKKLDEVESYKSNKSQFQWGIAGMIAVSLIPFIISVYFLVHEIPIETVINRIPRIALAILPLYIPVLWLSISSNKAMNLSKRLIEEYAHKEVLSKTFEGLSSQINDINEENISSDLRITLLQNFLYMYSENPGKLISNYDTSDHPVMELLENTNKLENTIERLNKIPGMNKLVKLLEKRVDVKYNKAVDKIEKGLDKVLAVTDEEEMVNDAEA